MTAKVETAMEAIEIATQVLVIGAAAWAASRPPWKSPTRAMRSP